MWAERYLEVKVLGIQSPNTEEAKRRDLKAFMDFFQRLNGHLDIAQWFARDTCAFLQHLEKLGRAPATINRVFRSLRHFARWVHEQPETPFVRSGVPTAGIKELAIDEPDAKKLEKREVWQLFKAADSLVLTETRKNSRPNRNRAILAIFYYTGLRVTELVRLRLAQWDGKRFQNVQRKGNVRTKQLYVPPEGRLLLDTYINGERTHDERGDQDWLFLPSNGDGPMTRRQIHKILVRIANEATKHHGVIHMHPHRLRHTFGFEVRERTKSDSETARHLGHQSEKYVGRYVRSTQSEREQILDTLGVGL
ncbi:tyrosine-type recombinase/integrase [Sorangium sp. So ce764]|uniref:tyrosine-type recombinase/integrase n=1 Tax=Sorangium sp. So ce764 TaxID=3133320 RepID=UPI003F630074